MILHVYLARRFMRLFLGVFAVLALFQFLIELMEELRRAPESLAFQDVLLLTALNLPGAVYEFLPLIMILASVGLFLGLSRSSELVVIRASGRSGLMALLGPVVAATALGCLVIAMVNPLVAATSKRYTTLSELYSTGSSSALSIGGEGLWLRQGGPDGQAVIHAPRANAEATVLYDVTIVGYAPGQGPNRRIEASRATLDDGAWLLEEARVWPLEPIAEGETAAARATDHPTLRLASSLTRDSIRDRFGRPSDVSIWALPAFIADLQRAGFSARRHTVWLHMELSRPVFLTAMLLVAAAFTMRPARFGRTGIAVLSAVLLGFGLYYVRNFARIMAESGQLAPEVAAWVPPVASVMLAVGLILHMEDG